MCKLTDSIKTALDISEQTAADFYGSTDRAGFSRLCTVLAVDRRACGIDAKGDRSTLSHAKAAYDTAQSVRSWLNANHIIDTVKEAAVSRENLLSHPERHEAIALALGSIADDADDDLAVSEVIGRWIAEETAVYELNSQLAHRTGLLNYLGLWAADDALKLRRVARVKGLLKGALKGATEAKRDAYAVKRSEVNQAQKSAPSDLAIKLTGIVNDCVAFDSLEDTGAPDYRDLILALMFVTGRRTAEVCSDMSTFTKLDDTYLSFKGAAKTKGRNDGLERVLEFPVPARSDAVIHAIELLKKAGHRSYDHKSVNAKFSMPLKRRMKALTGSDEFTPYSMRHMYASYSKARYYMPGQGDSDKAFVAKILGHFAVGNDGRVMVDMSTGASYETFDGCWNEDALVM